jgi:HPt (histidine-containing phosphotransfer) domain-containing protein
LERPRASDQLPLHHCTASGAVDFRSVIAAAAGILMNEAADNTQNPALSTQAFDGRAPSPEESKASARAIIGDDPTLLAMLAPVFAESSVSQLQKLAQALSQNDAAQVRHWAHSLKGSLASIGAAGPSARAGAIEARAKVHHLTGLGNQIDLLAAEVALVAANLTADTDPA